MEKIKKFFAFWRDIPHHNSPRSGNEQGFETVRAMLDATSEAVYLIDINGRVVDTNKIGAARFGRTPGELIGTVLYDYFPPEIFHERVDRINSVIATGAPVRFEDVRAGRNLRASVYPIKGATKKGAIVVIFSEDVTEMRQAEMEERKHALEELRQIQKSEQELRSANLDLQKFKLATDNTTDHVIITDIEGTILYANHAAEVITGYSVAEMAGQTPRLWGRQMSKKFYVDFWKTIKYDKRPFVGEVTNRRKSGEFYVADLRVAPVVTDDHVQFFVAIERDITREKDALKKEKDLAQRRALDEAILLSVGGGLVATDRDGSVTLVNNAFEKLLGWKPTEVVGKKLIEFLPRENEFGQRLSPKERLLPHALLGETVTSGIVHPTYLVRKDGSKFPASVIATPVVLDGDIIGAVEAFRDVTSDFEVDKAKTEFVSLASHQLRTPLTAINWYSEMLLDGDVGPLAKKQKEYLSEIYGAGLRMATLVKALLNVSRIELGTFAIEPKPTDIFGIARNVIKESSHLMAEKKQNVTEKFDESIGMVNVDPDLMGIIVQNFFTNAVKYTPEKGTITLTIEKREDQLVVSVSDTGYGIPEAQKDKIFEKFFRADNVKEKDTNGTGLGLYIAKEIAEKAGGKIWFESAENKGSTFYFSLPLSGMREKVGGKKLV
jgi:PAS domain S-box-containing protein